jgi:plasmid stabilization system protein ParE
MVEVVWTEPALSDLDAVADYIALDKPLAAKAFVRRVFDLVDGLRTQPRLGAKPPELRDSRYRQLVEPPCRIFYRLEGSRAYVLHVMRSERRLRATELGKRSKTTKRSPK